MCKHSESHNGTSTLKMLLLPYSVTGVQLSSGAPPHMTCFKPWLNRQASTLPEVNLNLKVLGTWGCLHLHRSYGNCSESFIDAEERVLFCTAGLALPVADHHLKQGSRFPSLKLQFPAPGAKKTSKDIKIFKCWDPSCECNSLLTAEAKEYSKGIALFEGTKPLDLFNIKCTLNPLWTHIPQSRFLAQDFSPQPSAYACFSLQCNSMV